MVQKKVLSQVGSKKLSVFVVWLPMVAGDSRDKAAESMKAVTDARAKHFWDGKREVGKAFSEHIKLPKGQELFAAWDYYALFDAAAKWADPAPAPSKWMHQLTDIEPARWLDGDKFRLAAEKLLKAAANE